MSMVINTELKSSRSDGRHRRPVLIFVVASALLLSGLSVLKHIATRSEQAAENQWLINNPPTVRYSDPIPH
jgi:hypothetical protein